MILPLSPGLHPTLGALGRMSLHLSPPYFPLWATWGRQVYTHAVQGTQSGCLGGDMSLHLSPALVSHSGCLGGAQVYTHVGPCLPLWVPSVGRHVWDTYLPQV